MTSQDREDFSEPLKVRLIAKLSPEERLERLRTYLQMLAPGDGIESFVEESRGLESAGDFGESVGGVQAIEGVRAIEKIELGKDIPTEDEFFGLEAIILPRKRPVVNIFNNTFAQPPSPWTHLSENAAKKNIETAIRAVGRIEVPGHPRLPYIGTGFVVGEGLIMTNRHVAEIAISGLGRRGLTFRPGFTTQIDFKREINPTDPEPVQLTSVVMIHPYWDMALLKADGLPAEHAMLSLSTEAPEELENHEVAVIGYPAQDIRNDIALQNRIFGGVYDVKRLQPGVLRQRGEIESYGNEVNALTHDCSTLGGNSGSLVVDVETGEIVALHFAGVYLKANYAVPTYELARDGLVVEAGVNFKGSVDVTQDWEPFWQTADAGESPESDLTTKSKKTGNVQQSLPTNSTWTIPLRVTVSLDAPVQGTSIPTDSSGTVSSQFVPGQAEGLFGGDAPEIGTEIIRSFSKESLTNTSFDWTTALSTALASSLAYGSEGLIEQRVIRTWGMPDAKPFNTGVIQCFAAIDEDVLLIVFRGTDEVRDWLTNIDLRSRSRPYGSVHRGFLVAFESITTELEQVIDDHPCRSIVLTGHSLGGALATIAAAAWNGTDRIQSVYTFGQPAVGKRDFREFMRLKYPENFHRFVNDDDIVAQVPPGFRHVGRLHQFDADGQVQSFQESLSGLESNSNREVMSEKAFHLLQKRLRLGVPPQGDVPSEESMGLEGFFPSIKDHDMNRYIYKTFRQIG